MRETDAAAFPAPIGLQLMLPARRQPPSCLRCLAFPSGTVHRGWHSWPMLHHHPSPAFSQIPCWQHTAGHCQALGSPCSARMPCPPSAGFSYVDCSEHWRCLLPCLGCRPVEHNVLKGTSLSCCLDQQDCLLETACFLGTPLERSYKLICHPLRALASLIWW